MIDDFWGDEEWENTRQQMVKIFPDRPITELELDHPIYSTVFQLKEKPQVPSIEYAMSGRSTGIFYEKGGKVVHYYGIFDAKGRMMVIICRNTDLGDGWEREGEDPLFFQGIQREKGLSHGHQHHRLLDDALRKNQDVPKNPSPRRHHTVSPRLVGRASRPDTAEKCCAAAGRPQWRRHWENDPRFPDDTFQLRKAQTGKPLPLGHRLPGQ